METVEQARAKCRRWYRKNATAQRSKKLATYHASVAKMTPDELAALVTRRRAGARKWKAGNQGAVNANTAARYAAKVRAVPSWSDPFLVGEAYDLAVRRTVSTGIRWNVDHVVPLRSRVVCGLHCEANVAVIPAAVNQRKNNHHWPDMPC